MPKTITAPGASVAQVIEHKNDDNKQISPDGTNSEDAEEFKESIMKNVERLLPKGVTSVHTRTIASMLLKESLQGVQLDPGQDKVSMGTTLVSGMVKELGLSRQQVENFIAQIEKESGDNGLRAAVLAALDKDVDRDQSVEGNHNNSVN